MARELKLYSGYIIIKGIQTKICVRSNSFKKVADIINEHKYTNASYNYIKAFFSISKNEEQLNITENTENIIFYYDKDLNKYIKLREDNEITII